MIGNASYVTTSDRIRRVYFGSVLGGIMKVAGIVIRSVFTPKDAAEAFRLYLAAATAGDQDDQVSMTKLGSLYEAGSGVRKDYAQAVTWYRKSVDRGEVAAMKQLGRLYEGGRGVPKSPTEAGQWYAKAAKLEAAHAQ
jgi:TPR repeat protein